MQEKTFLVIYQEETDGETFIVRMTKEEIVDKFKNERFGINTGELDSLAIIDGELIKNFDTKFDINRLK